MNVASRSKTNKKQAWRGFKKCCWCQKEFKNRSNLKRHLEAVHCKTTKFKCDLCSKIFYTKNSISQHIANVHSEKRFSCDVCDFETKIFYTLKEHKLIHAPKVECPVCKKQVTSLKVHMLTHRHKPRIQCTICGKAILPKTMKFHLRLHSKKWDCSDCNEVFQNLEDFKR